MRADVFLIMYFVSQSLWGAGAIAAYRTRTLTPNQMRRKNVHKGMCYLWHIGMWDDVVAIHPYLALMTALLWPLWATISPWVWIIFFLISLIVGQKVQRSWSSNMKVIESHNKIEYPPNGAPRPTGKPSAVGWVHVPHIALIVTLGVATLVSSMLGYVPWRLVLAGILLFAGHVLAGTHWLLRYYDPPGNPWDKDERSGMHGIANIVCTSLGFFFVFWHFVALHAA